MKYETNKKMKVLHIKKKIKFKISTQKILRTTDFLTLIVTNTKILYKLKYENSKHCGYNPLFCANGIKS